MDGAQSTNPANAVESRDEHMKIDDLDNSEFLDLLEQNVGRRWPKKWLRRLYTMSPWMYKATTHGTTDAAVQRADIEALRRNISRFVLARLTR